MREQAQAIWGHHCQDYLKPSDPHFLREGHTTFPAHEIVFQLTEPSHAIITDGLRAGAGEGWIIVEGQDASGGYFEHGIHKEKVIWTCTSEKRE